MKIVVDAPPNQHSSAGAPIRWYRRPRWWVIALAGLLVIAITAIVVPRMLLVNRTARTVSELGGQLLIEQERFSVLHVIIGWGDNVVVELRESRATDDDVRRLTDSFVQLGGVRDLYLSGTDVTDACLASIAQLTRLTSLHLARTQITGRGLEHLRDLPKLDAINLDGSLVDDTGLAELAQISRLTTVNIDNTYVTDEGVKCLSQLPHLNLLSAANTGLTDAGASQLAETHPDLDIFDD